MTEEKLFDVEIKCKSSDIYKLKDLGANSIYDFKRKIATDKISITLFKKIKAAGYDILFVRNDLEEPEILAENTEIRNCVTIPSRKPEDIVKALVQIVVEEMPHGQRIAILSDDFEHTANNRFELNTIQCLDRDKFLLSGRWECFEALYKHYGNKLLSIQNVESFTPDRKTFFTGAERSNDADSTRYDLISSVGLRRLAETYAEGAKKYSDHNWRKGIPSSECMNHAQRHLNIYLSGDRSEDHLAHAAWNLFTIMDNEENLPEMMDFWQKPNAEQK